MASHGMNESFSSSRVSPFLPRARRSGEQSGVEEESETTRGNGSNGGKGR